jgi:multicomponent Na+:H+ antiporter subunit E
MKIFPMHVILVLAWCLLTGNFSIVNVAFGTVMAYLALLVARRGLPESSYYSLPFRFVEFAVRLLFDLLIASGRLVVDVLTPRDRFHPRLVAVPLIELEDSEITLFANSLSLTPGTLTIDVSPDKRWLFVHAMYAEDVDETIRELVAVKERRVLKFLRPEMKERVS